MSAKSLGVDNAVCRILVIASLSSNVGVFIGLRNYFTLMQLPLILHNVVHKG